MEEVWKLRTGHKTAYIAVDQMTTVSQTSELHQKTTADRQNLYLELTESQPGLKLQPKAVADTSNQRFAKFPEQRLWNTAVTSQLKRLQQTQSASRQKKPDRIVDKFSVSSIRREDSPLDSLSNYWKTNRNRIATIDHQKRT